MPGSSGSPAAGYSRSGDGSHSASAIVAGAVTGSHVLKIVFYSRTKEVPNRQVICSRHFRLGGHTWFVKYYPNGNAADKADFISLYLAIHGAVVGKPVKAQVTISLLDQDGKPVPSYTKVTPFVDFAAKGDWGYTEFIERKALEESEHLRDDSFTVRFDVTIMSDIQTVEMPSVVVPPSDMHRHYADLLLSKEGADVKFRIGGQTFSAHRLVLSTRSPVFKAELFGPMRESTTTNAIRIDDMEPEVFDALLTFIYTDTLPETKDGEGCAMAQHLLVAADRYDLERLKLICEDKLCRYIDTGSAATILALAEKHNCHGLKDACFALLSSAATLGAFMETDGFDHLTVSCPSLLKELFSKFVPT
jgi:speckle-type POZ protein